MLTTVKKNPTRVVSYIQDQRFRVTPFIRLQGKWLEDAGFGIGNLFVAEIVDDKIILTKKETIE